MTTAASASSSPTIKPKRGEVWRVQLDPVRGSEQAKTRPVVVLSEPPNERPTMRICAPAVHAKPEHMAMIWCVSLVPDALNGLSKPCTCDTSQVRSLDISRFETKLGQVDAPKLQTILAALAACIAYFPKPDTSTK